MVSYRKCQFAVAQFTELFHKQHAPEHPAPSLLDFWDTEIRTATIGWQIGKNIHVVRFSWQELDINGHTVVSKIRWTFPDGTPRGPERERGGKAVMLTLFFRSLNLIQLSFRVWCSERHMSRSPSRTCATETLSRSIGQYLCMVKGKKTMRWREKTQWHHRSNSLTKEIDEESSNLLLTLVRFQ